VVFSVGNGKDLAGFFAYLFRGGRNGASSAPHPRRADGRRIALLIQPALYQRGQLGLHRALGRWDVYLWLPAMMVFGFPRDGRMIRLHNAPPNVIDQLAFLDLVSLILFPLLVIFAIRHGFGTTAELGKP